MNVIQSSTPMKSDPNESSNLETECLFGETVEILEKHFDWVYCKLLTDNYLGWIKKNSLGFLKTPTHQVISKRTFLYKNPNSRSICINYLPMCSKLYIKNIIDKWAETVIVYENIVESAYVPIEHIMKINRKVKDWVITAEKLLETPYKWGGRDTIGIDCSALIQLSYETFGQKIPRNTVDQVKIDKEIIVDFKELKRGHVVFWEGHVGLMVDEFNCIHANAFHMKTVIEPLKEIILRMNGKNKIKKMMNFNN